MDMEQIQPYLDKGIELSMAYFPKVLLAVITLIVGFWIIKRVIKGMNRLLGLKAVDDTLQKFMTSLVDVLLKILLLVAVAGMVGVQTTSFIAMLGAMGLAVGLALQGSLGNFAGGVLILLFKPYRVGDIIEAQGHTGKVWDIQIFNTILTTYDNQRIVIPNGLMSNGCIKNIFVEPQRRIDIEFGIGYGDSIEQARAAIQSVIDNDDRILDGGSFDADIFVSAHADSSITMLTRAWVNSEDYWPVYFGLFEQVKYAFDKAGITIPFPQRDVHLFQQSGGES
ncbi:mechanosensitive ion channel protein [Alcanivorax sp. 97CO-5]|jgi:small conductance mechanosensitive channel|uniref:mechanosensitive ion channel family protein n=1 Tax=unclassified Alcanivorax TaxID=2638842 RepID=UPI0003E7E141|nr:MULTISPECIES: mechanosensitive ion channel domain-containing protein [unclassified Alcanivorax]EUC68782.1 mechanosensitive ion channel protein [Alcanivorax sp. 97CO-5]PKG00849.1 mechanosensitive ion channel protein [Alcanivorax sp. 97CO-6]